MNIKRIQSKEEIDFMFNNILSELTLECSKCGSICVIRKKSNFYKRCTFKLCQKEESISKNTIFYYKKLDVYDIVLILRLWFSKVPVTAIAELLEISKKTISAYLKKALNIIEKRYFDNFKAIGGPGIIVEIDESKFGRKKYHRGHRVDGVWVLGMVERINSKRIILIPVPDRKSETLFNLTKNMFIQSQ